MATPYRLTVVSQPEPIPVCADCAHVYVNWRDRPDLWHCLAHTIETRPARRSMVDGVYRDAVIEHGWCRLHNEDGQCQKFKPAQPRVLARRDSVLSRSWRWLTSWGAK